MTDGKKDLLTKYADVYHRKAMKAIAFRMHNVNDADVIAYVKSQKNQAGWFRKMVRREIEEKKKAGE